ncbi:integrase core domain-containing protein [Leptolyngbya sp. 'hensonii']
MGLKEVQRWFHWYNQERPHQALKYRTPEMVYWETHSRSVSERESLSKDA